MGYRGVLGYVSAGAISSPDLQAAFIARYYLLHWSTRISRLYWYGWDNEDIGTLCDSRGCHTAAATAYVQVRAWMLDATMTRPCATSDNSPVRGIYTCELKRKNSYHALAIWDTRGTSSYLTSNAFTSYRELDGHKAPVPPDHQVRIGLKPILLESFP